MDIERRVKLCRMLVKMEQQRTWADQIGLYDATGFIGETMGGSMPDDRAVEILEKRD